MSEPRRVLRFSGLVVTIDRRGWLYRYAVHRDGVVLRYGSAFTLWGVRHAARHA